MCLGFALPCLRHSSLNIQIADVWTHQTTLSHVIVILVQNCGVGYKAMNRHSYQSRSPQVLSTRRTLLGRRISELLKRLDCILSYFIWRPEWETTGISLLAACYWSRLSFKFTLTPHCYRYWQFLPVLRLLYIWRRDSKTMKGNVVWHLLTLISYSSR